MKLALPALCALLLLPAPATAAPTLAPLKACYVSAVSEEQASSEAISVGGSGFTPGATVDLQLDGNAAGRTTAGSDGAFAYGINAPIQSRGEREFTITAVEAGQAPVSVTSRVTALRVTGKPKNARPTQAVTFGGRGFTEPDIPVYMHYVLRGRVRRTVRLATPQGPCGTFSVRRRQFPFRRPATGMWTLRIEQDPRYRTESVKPHFLIDVLVQRRPVRD